MPPSTLLKRVFRPAQNVAQKSLYASTRFFCNNPTWDNFGVKDPIVDKTVEEIDTKEPSKFHCLNSGMLEYSAGNHTL